MADTASTDFSAEWHTVLRVWRRRKWTAIVFTVVTVLAAAAATWMQTPEYQATATVLIDMESPSVLAVSRGGDDSTIGLTNYLTYADYYRTQLEIISSRAILRQVADNLDLAEQPEYASGDSDSDSVGLLANNVEVDPIKQTRLAKIHVNGRDPKLAARIANEIGVVYAQENLERANANEAMTFMKNEYLKLQAKEAELSKRYKSKHPSMLRAHQEMDELARAIEQETGRQARDARRQAEGDEDVETQSEAATSKWLHDPATMSGGLRPNNIRVQDLARVPSSPSKPKKALNLLLGLVLGLVGGLALAVVQELLDSSLKSPDEIEGDDASSVPLLGYIPRIEGPAMKLGRQPMDRYHHVKRDPYSLVAEAYRALRTSLLYKAATSNASAIVVTSPGMGEGKTTTLCNLGITLAQTGMQILLVDADLRKGRLHEVFSLKRGPGLSEYLQGGASFDKIVQPTTIPGLSVVTAGAFPPNPAELVSNARMKELVDAAVAKFGRVLIDSPPLIAVTDAAVLAALTKTVLVVAQSGRTPRQALRRVIARCREVRAKLLGVVLNNVPPRDVPAYTRYSPYRYEAAEHNGSSKPSDLS